eukprot:Rmarinus@m.29639
MLTENQSRPLQNPQLFTEEHWKNRDRIRNAPPRNAGRCEDPWFSKVEFHYTKTQRKEGSLYDSVSLPVRPVPKDRRFYNGTYSKTLRRNQHELRQEKRRDKIASQMEQTRSIRESIVERDSRVVAMARREMDASGLMIAKLNRENLERRLGTPYQLRKDMTRIMVRNGGGANPQPTMSTLREISSLSAPHPREPSGAGWDFGTLALESSANFSTDRERAATSSGHFHPVPSGPLNVHATPHYPHFHPSAPPEPPAATCSHANHHMQSSGPHSGRGEANGFPGSQVNADTARTRTSVRCHSTPGAFHQPPSCMWDLTAMQNLLTGPTYTAEEESEARRCLRELDDFDNAMEQKRIQTREELQKKTGLSNMLYFPNRRPEPKKGSDGGRPRSIEYRFT